MCIININRLVCLFSAYDLFFAGERNFYSLYSGDPITIDNPSSKIIQDQYILRLNKFKQEDLPRLSKTN